MGLCEPPRGFLEEIVPGIYHGAAFIDKNDSSCMQLLPERHVEAYECVIQQRVTMGELRLRLCEDLFGLSKDSNARHALYVSLRNRNER